MAYLLDWDAIKEEVKEDPELQSHLQACEKGEETSTKWTIVRGQLYYKGRMVLSKSSRLKNQILEEFHASPIGGHGGFLKTYKRISAELYWQGMKTDVKNFVATCKVCQQNKYETLSPAGLLQPFPVPRAIWEEISMDFIEGLPKSHGYDSLLVVVDRLSKYCHLLLLKHPFTSKQVAEEFLKQVVKLHGFPRSIVSDRDKIFLSNFWRELFRLQHTKLHHSTAYHPQSDGQSEVVNRCIETYLRCFINQRPKEWSKWVPWAEYWYNTSFHTSIQSTPFKIVYGRDPPPLIRYEYLAPTTNVELDTLLHQRDIILEELREQLILAQNRMKRVADQGRRDVEYKEGDWVYLKLRPYRQKTLAKRLSEKLSPRFFGPFRVTQRIGQVAYKLELPENVAIHPVFHVSQLKKVIGDVKILPTIPPSLTQDLEWVVEPERILGERMSAVEKELLIKWRHLPEFEATWEPLSFIQLQFPNFHLEDKVKLKGKGNDKPPVHLVYQRRKKAQMECCPDAKNGDERETGQVAGTTGQLWVSDV